MTLDDKVPANGLSNGTMRASMLNGNDMKTPINNQEPNGFLKPNTNGSVKSTTNGLHGNKSADTPPPIAIVGMALRLPGGLKSPEALWEFLINKHDARARIPKDRYNVDAFYGKSKPGEVASQYGYFLDDNLEHFDAGFFSMSRTEVAELDPQQRLLLEVVYECMESAGQKNWRGSKIGTFVGAFGEDWLDLFSKDPQNYGFSKISASGDFILSNRISYEYDLKGPSMTIRTGCSSGLIGLHEACEALYAHQCESAIVAGSNIIITPTMTQGMTVQGVLSKTGSCKTFDAAADGYARGEAVNAILVKRLDDALRDGDPIRAVIRATSTNCDGKTAGMYNPSSEAHETLIRMAYDRASLPPKQTAFVECHGTGTPVGDPLETNAVGNVFEGSGAYIGSVKPNVGHSEGASGITSLIKAVLALENRTIPPNIKFSKPNPRIRFEESGLVVPLEPTPWPEYFHERASVNSFGIGGANAHVVLDSTASFLKHNGLQHKGSNGVKHFSQLKIPSLLPVSANTADSLRRRMVGYQHYIQAQPSGAADVAYTLSSRREDLPYRSFGIVNDTGAVEFSNVQKASRTSPLVNFVFTGQGAQWAGMGAQLMDAFDSFRQDIQHLDKVLQQLPDGPKWKLEEELKAPEGFSRINDAELSQPLCTVLQIALVNLLEFWGVRPSAVVGHSSGEIAAAYAAKAITAETAIIIAYYRGQAIKAQKRSGGMAAVGLGRDGVTRFLLQGVVIACENSPESVTLSGDSEELETVLGNIKSSLPDVFCRRLRVEKAYHSHHMAEIGEHYEALMSAHVRSTKPEVPLYSSVHVKSVKTAGMLNGSYWRANLENPVLFRSAVGVILNDQDEGNVFLEVGPHTALSGPLRQIFQHHQAVNTYIGTLLRKEDEVSSLLKTAGALYQQGAEVDLSKINRPGKVLTDLPPYPWQHDTSFWAESRICRNWRLRPHAHHELLGSRTLESSDIEPCWRNMLALDNAPWLRHHKIVEDIVFPAAGYIAAVGEAIRQITGSSDYTIRRFVVNNALVLQDSQTTEIITSLKPVRLTDTLDSEWYEFTIASFEESSSSWTIHCKGQARQGGCTNIAKGAKTSYSRPIREGTWYKIMKEMGLNYGPSFQGLRNINTHFSDNIASATVKDTLGTHDSKYAVHPTTIDQMLQLFTVAISNGLSRRFSKLAIPATMGEISISDGGPEFLVEVEASVTPHGAVRGIAEATSNGKSVISCRDAVFHPFEADGPSSQASNDDTLARPKWLPDIDFLTGDEVMHRNNGKREGLLLFEHVSVLCLIETQHRVQGLKTGSEHMAKFQSWLNAEVERISQGLHDHICPDASQWARMTSEERVRMLKELSETAAKNSVSQMLAPISQRILDNCVELIQGNIGGLELLMEADGLTTYYNSTSDIVDFMPFFQLLGHAKPNLRVLEIGAGTGSISSRVLEALAPQGSTRMYSQYHYTDISSGFFAKAKERFGAYHGVRYSVLDISKEPTDQGLPQESYDLVIASNVLHATPSLKETLQNVRKLLAPGGRLFLHELSMDMRQINYIMGILPGWWLGSEDNRVQEPFVKTDRWNDELIAAGFSGIDTVVYDDEKPYQTNAHIISTATTESSATEKNATFIYQSEKSKLARDLANQFESEGYTVKWQGLDDEPCTNETYVMSLDLESSFLYDVSPANFASLQDFISRCNARSCTIIWPTKPSQVSCEDPQYGLLPGFARVIRSETSIKLFTIESKSFDREFWSCVVKISDKVKRKTQENDLDLDFEYAVFQGQIHIPRYHWTSLDSGAAESKLLDAPVYLDVEKYGSLGSLTWKQDEPRKELTENQVEIEIRSVGLNFRDVLCAMGIVESVRPEIGKANLGLEGSGIVLKVGPDVKSLSVGDRVFMFDGGCFRTTVVTKESLCARISDKLNFEDAATMTVVYTTVIHSLLNIGGLEENQSVLIHSACGGVGIAAIQICLMKGAEIYATVGNEEKAQYLVDTFKIPRNRIFDSRSNSFLSSLMAATEGRGVDLVLNSLSGELLHASWNCVAPYGKMLEIGKRDFIGHGMLAMDLFAKNRSFFGIDLGTLVSERPDKCQALLQQCLLYYSQGFIQPIEPMKTFAASNIVDAFRYMQQGQHMGKIVVNMPSSPDELPLTKSRQHTKFRNDASYLLVGGLGGLGRAISIWMVENGARNLIYLSRSAGRMPADQAFFSELESQGCRVYACPGSVTVEKDVERAVVSAHAPVAGVIQMSMVLRDENFLQMKHDDWTAATMPKVTGTLNLHNVLKDSKLDFFLLFSSISGVIGQWGQSNYAAANTYLDSFVRYRHQIGLSGSVIDIGAMKDIGYLMENGAMIDRLGAMGAKMVGEAELLQAVSLAIERSFPAVSDQHGNGGSQLTIGLGSTKPIDDPSNRLPWKRDVRMALYRNRDANNETGTAESDRIKNLIGAVVADPDILNLAENQELLTHEIGLRIKSLIFSSEEEELDPRCKLTDAGVDSLVSIEIRNWWRRTFGLEISVLEIMNAATVGNLGKLALEGLGQKYGEGRGSHPVLVTKAP